MRRWVKRAKVDAGQVSALFSDGCAEPADGGAETGSCARTRPEDSAAAERSPTVSRSHGIPRRRLRRRPGGVPHGDAQDRARRPALADPASGPDGDPRLHRGLVQARRRQVVLATSARPTSGPSVTKEQSGRPSRSVRRSGATAPGPIKRWEGPRRHHYVPRSARPVSPTRSKQLLQLDENTGRSIKRRSAHGVKGTPLTLRHDRWESRRHL